ncbi:MAG: hypothetical protein HY901_24830, partial [Deltaproteobacteria bacterium]|nr:hypothetical protein [Deltaproteobacteria bacterium]
MRAFFVLLLAAVVSVPAAAASSRGFLESLPGAQVHLRAGRSTPSLVTNLDVTLPVGDRDAAIARLIVEGADFFGFDSALSTFQPGERPTTFGKVAVHRFAQHHQGLPVLGAEIAVTVDERGRIRMMAVGAERIGLLPIDFRVTEAEAVKAALAHVRPRKWSGQIKSARKAIAEAGDGFRAVWEVRFASAAPIGAWRVLVDAEEPVVHEAANHFMNLNQGLVYPNSPEVDHNTTTQVTLTNLTSTTRLTGASVQMFSDCIPAAMGGDCGPSDRVSLADSNGDYLIAPNEGSVSDGFAEVHTYHHLEQMHAWFKANNFNGLDFVMDVGVNYANDNWGTGMNCNAGYGENAIIVGLCDLSLLGKRGWVNFAYDSLSVMHEYTHGAVDHSAAFVRYKIDDWGLVAQQMGLHEGFADFFPAMVLDDPKIGRHVGPKTGTGEYFRNLEDVRTCPDHVVGESHDDGQ